MLAGAEEMERRRHNYTPLCFDGFKLDPLYGPRPNRITANRQEQEAYEMRRAVEWREAAIVWRGDNPS